MSSAGHHVDCLSLSRWTKKPELFCRCSAFSLLLPEPEPLWRDRALLSRPATSTGSLELLLDLSLGSAGFFISSDLLQHHAWLGSKRPGSLAPVIKAGKAQLQSCRGIRPPAARHQKMSLKIRAALSSKTHLQRLRKLRCKSTRS